MTEFIQQKLQEIKVQRENAIAQLNALAGAEQVLTELLKGSEEFSDAKPEN